MEISSKLPAEGLQSGSTGPDTGSGDAIDVTGAASQLDDNLNKQKTDSAENSKGSENGAGLASSNNESVDESEKQSGADNEDNPSDNAESDKKPDLLKELMELIQKAASDEAGSPEESDEKASQDGPEKRCANCMKNNENAAGSEAGGGGNGSQDSSSNSGGAGGSNLAASGGGGAGGNGDAEPVGEQQAESLDGKVKFHAENAEDAEKLKETFDEMYKEDKDFKKHVDEKIEKDGSLDVTAKDLPKGTAGVAELDGNKMAIDTEHLDDKEVIAHELLHNVGHDHGPEHDAAIAEAIDGN